ncbi:MAG: diaminopimelate decarboxylase [Nitrospirae bacterium RBG_19FT_COMBO_42_15]|nr:MAG: diaminopimelate decarboxylase [Nitrospirae bacterium RBG_19FT_COMBO_42_15]
MHDFNYKDKELYCEDVSIAKIAEDIGTPFYLYSQKTLTNHFKNFDEAFSAIPHIVCFAVKANPNISVLKLFANEGGGADIVSGGELFRALKAGVPAEKIVYAGVGKTNNEIRAALYAGILMFNVESSEELIRIDEISGRIGIKARIALRVNPDIDPKTHPYISTGLKKNKFGIPIEEALESYQTAMRLTNVEIVGIHKHIGSQLTEISPFVDALKRILRLADNLKKEGINIKYIDVGGGLGITYKDEEPPAPKELAKAIVPLIKGKKRDYTLILEPGRVLAGNAGILVTRVLYQKKSGRKNFVIVDAGMNDLIRPSLYSAYHNIIPVRKKPIKKFKADIVGPICESGDFLGKNREIACEQEDLLAVMSAGAYGSSMSSNYNSRPLIAEVMVKGRDYHIIRKRQDYEDIIIKEEVPSFLR